MKSAKSYWGSIAWKPLKWSGGGSHRPRACCKWLYRLLLILLQSASVLKLGSSAAAGSLSNLHCPETLFLICTEKIAVVANSVTSFGIEWNIVKELYRTAQYDLRWDPCAFAATTKPYFSFTRGPRRLAVVRRRTVATYELPLPF